MNIWLSKTTIEINRIMLNKTLFIVLRCSIVIELSMQKRKKGHPVATKKEKYTLSKYDFGCHWYIIFLIRIAILSYFKGKTLGTWDYSTKWYHQENTSLKWTPITPHFHIVKLGFFPGIHILFLLLKHRFRVLVRTASVRLY